jgi:hypothetical protein
MPNCAVDRGAALTVVLKPDDLKMMFGARRHPLGRIASELF